MSVLATIVKILRHIEAMAKEQICYTNENLLAIYYVEITDHPLNVQSVNLNASHTAIFTHMQLSGTLIAIISGGSQ